MEYTEPKILNTGPKWSVFFRAINPATDEKKLFRFEEGLNRKQSNKERIQKANYLRDYLSAELSSGWNPFLKKKNKQIDAKTLVEAIEDVLAKKKSSIKPKSYRGYVGVIHIFCVWAKDNGYEKMMPFRFSNRMAHEYLDYLLTERKYSGKSHNNHLGVMKAFFGSFIERDPEIYKLNPFSNIRELPEDSGKNNPFTEAEKSKLTNYFKETDPHYYAACSFVYFCFFRSTELIELKVGSIDLVNMTIMVSSESAKNRTQQSVTIPKAMEPIIASLHLDKYPSDWYIFGRYNKINSQKTMKSDYFSYKFRKMADMLGIDKTKGFYAWKHSGVCALYNATKDPYLVCQQARHHDIKVTMIYLRSLGLTVNERIREARYFM